MKKGERRSSNLFIPILQHNNIMTASIFSKQHNNINFNQINNLVKTDETLFLYSLNKHHINQLKSYPPYYPLN